LTQYSGYHPEEIVQESFDFLGAIKSFKQICIFHLILL
jgi:hypothetical protein